MALAILFTYGLQFYIPSDILWRKIGHKFSEKNQNISQILLRTGIILISGGVAAAIPDLEPFISLVGAVFFSLLGKGIYSLSAFIQSNYFKYFFLNRFLCTQRCGNGLLLAK